MCGSGGWVLSRFVAGGVMGGLKIQDLKFKIV
jgi:hypothetical protein